jgi:hypothetical protein
VLEELSEVLTLGVAAAAGMYKREYEFVAAVAAAGHRKSHSNTTHISSSGAGYAGSSAVNADDAATPTRAGSGSPHSTHDAVIHVLSPDAASTSTVLLPPTGRPILQQQQDKQQQAAGLSSDQQQLLQQPPKLLLGRMMGALVPVEFAVQRDTWLAWRRGHLAVAPVRVVDLSFVVLLFALGCSVPNEPVVGSPNGRCFLCLTPKVWNVSGVGPAAGLSAEQLLSCKMAWKCCVVHAGSLSIDYGGQQGLLVR